MASQQVVIERAGPRAWAVPWIVLSYVAIGLIALLPRVLDLGRWLSGDEASFWLRRSELFLRAVRAGDFSATASTTHPGVTTMWLGSAGLGLHDTLARWGILHDFSFPTFLAIVRLPTALAHVAGVLLGYALLRRLFAPAVAALAALLWAADPFVIAFSRVLHVDALPATFMTISLLAACLYWYHERRASWLSVSAVAGGLAVLSKSPSLALVPAIGAIALLAAVARDQSPKMEDQRRAIAPPPFVFRLSSFVLPLLAWAAVAALTVFALWPALWVGPLRAYDQLRLGVEAEGASPHMLGNFFLGQEDDAPGLLFYPVALALRLTPWTMLGLLALPVVWRRARGLERRDLAALACFTLLFVAAMSVFPKKFNRYLVPVFPAVDILAAFGLATLMGGTPQRPTMHRPGPSTRGAVGLAVVILAAGINMVYWHPYGITAFNQLLGGAAAGPRTFAIGWGEGLSAAADWLNEQPDITEVRVAATMTTGLQSYLRPGAQAVVPNSDTLPPKTGYVLIYARSVQWDRPWAPFDQFYGVETPLHVVRIHGIDYAWIYRAPPPVARPREAHFGQALQLRGYTPISQPGSGKPLIFTLVWKALTRPERDYMLFAHLLGADGQRHAQVDLPLPTGTWEAGRYQATELVVPLPVDIPPGRYRLVVGMYDPNGGPRLPLTVAAQIDPALDGPDALPLAEVVLK